MMNILCIEDSTFFQKVFAEEFSNQDKNLFFAKSYSEAINVLSTESIDFITLDIELPGENGHEICSKIRNELNNEFIPILFVTSNDTHEDRVKGFAAGATDFIGKKFHKGELLFLTNKIIERSHQLKTSTVLIVDDSVVSRSLTRNFLKHKGANIDLAEDGQEAYTLIKENDYDLIISDLHMPVMDGKELCKKVRQELGNNHTPIIMLSGEHCKETQAELFKVGATDYVTKPYEKEELEARILAHLEKSYLYKNLSENNQELKRLSKLRDEFFAICSHDLRAPLNPILGYTELLLAGVMEEDEKIQTYQEIRNSANLLLNLMNDLLDLSKFQSGSFDPARRVKLNLSTISEQCLKIFDTMAKQKEVILEISLPNSPIETKAVENDISRLLSNLLSNAIKFSRKGDRVVLALELKDKNAVFKVVDTGIGIPEDKIKDIYNMYSKVSRAGTSGEKGTGLGMKISQEIVKSYDGTIDIESKEGRGTSFIIKLPIQL